MRDLDAVNRACELVEQLGAGEVIDGIIDVDNSDPNHKRLPFEPDKMNALLGLELSAEEQVGAPPSKNVGFTPILVAAI